MICSIRAALACALLVLASPALAQEESAKLLSNASASGGTISVRGSGYQFSVTGTFGGATVALYTSAADGTMAAVSGCSFTAAGSCTTNIGNGGSVQARVTGGSPSGLYAWLQDLGGPVSTGGGGGGGGGDASAANQTAVQAVAGSDASKAVAIQGITGGKSIGVATADALTSGTIASGTLNAAYTVTFNSGAGTVGIAISGLTASGATLTLEGDNDGSTWTTLNSVSAGTGALYSTVTADGQYRIPVQGRRGIRLRVSTIGTGTITVASNVSSAPHEMAIDPNNAAYQGEVPMTVGTVYAVARSLKAACTATGNVNVTYADGSTGTWAISAAGTTVLPIAVTTVNSSGTTATCTYSNMK